MTSPDACVCTFPHGAGESGDRPCAALEAWVWSVSPLAVTFGGFAPAGDKQWRIAIWLAIAAEAARRAAEEEAGHPLPPWGG